MPTETELAEARQQILDSIMDDLAVLRQEAMALPQQSQIDSVIEAIDCWVPVLRECNDYAEMLENCGRAVADVTHQLAAEKYGWEAAEAVFDEEDRKLSSLIRRID